MKFSLAKLYLMLMFYVSPFVDAVSGYMILSKMIPEGGAGSPSQVFRLLVMVLSLIILTKNKKYFATIIVILGYIILLEFVFYNMHLNLSGYIIGLVYGSKILYLVFLFLTLNQLHSMNYIDFDSLLKYLQRYALLTAILLIVPFVFGIGFSSYAEGTFGTKGFFAAGNGLGIFMGVGLFLSIYYWQHTRARLSLVVSMLLVFSTAIIGTKTALIFFSFGLFLIIFYFKSKYVSYFIFILILSILVIYYESIVDLFTTVFDVILYRLNNNDSFISFMMSNRDVYFQDAINSTSFDGVYLIRLIFGFGAFVSFRNPYEKLTGIDTLESDFSDIFFMYGLFPLLIYIFIILYFITQFIVNKQFFLGLIFFMLAVHSLVAGHVLFNGMSGVMVPFLILLNIFYSKKKLIKEGFR